MTFYLGFFVWHILYSDILSGILSGIYSDILSGIYADILSGSLAGIYSVILFCHSIWNSILAYYLAYIHSLWHGHSFATFIGARWDLALAVEVRQWPLRSGACGRGLAHWNLELAVEVRHCPLTSGARRWEAEEEGLEEGGGRGGESNSDKIYRDPHLAGGEQQCRQKRSNKVQPTNLNAVT